MNKIYILLLLGLLLTSCTTNRFDINTVDFSYEYTEQNILPLRYHDRSNLNLETANKIIKSIAAKDSNVWGYYYVQHNFDRSEKKIFDIINIDYVTLIAHILGVPEARVHYNLNANVYLFDSYGNIVEIYEKKGYIMKYRGLYYGYDYPIEDMSKEYKRMFKEIIDDISTNRERTNNLLLLSGALEDDNTTETYTKIYMIVK
ncbi:MAG: hypothetical protein LBC75_12185 [Fibromonadaceae bacterium]|jgi:hypothetical protein|nr:hypothetical protein [Fibromonadaceae bacterium]